MLRSNQFCCNISYFATWFYTLNPKVNSQWQLYSGSLYDHLYKSNSVKDIFPQRVFAMKLYCGSGSEKRIIMRAFLCVSPNTGTYESPMLFLWVLKLHCQYTN